MVNPKNIWIERAKDDYVVDTGQLTPDDIRDLNTAVKRGELIKHKGYWNTGLNFGLGSLRTVWRAKPPVLPYNKG